MRLSAPEPIAPHHEVDSFDSGVASLDDWLKRRARANQASGASRTYVVSEERRVVAYYCLASGALSTSDAPGRLRRNMPDPIPMAVLGRLAIDRSRQGQGVGTALLRDAIERTVRAAEVMGVRGIMVHALSEDAKAFYERRGFITSRTSPMLLVMSLKGLS